MGLLEDNNFYVRVKNHGKKFLVITGASRGIGRATAELFLAADYQVINISRRDPQLEGVQHISADLAVTGWAEAVADIINQWIERASQITIIHGAGLLLKDNIDTVSAEDLHRVMQVNVIAPKELNQLILPSMAAGSAIIYVGSTLSEKAVAAAVHM